MTVRTSILRPCLAISVGAIALSAVLLSTGVPGAVLLAVAPALVCVGMHLVMGHGDPHGEGLLRAARAAAAREAERPADGAEGIA